MKPSKAKTNVATGDDWELEPADWSMKWPQFSGIDLLMNSLSEGHCLHSSKYWRWGTAGRSDALQAFLIHVLRSTNSHINWVLVQHTKLMAAHAWSLFTNKKHACSRVWMDLIDVKELGRVNKSRHRVSEETEFRVQHGWKHQKIM